jgi:glucose/mannose-6-phosphate isomerase
MNKEKITAIDKQNLFKVIKDFPRQVEDAVKNASGFSNAGFKKDDIKNIIVTGLGGSAIGGDFVRSYLANELTVPFNVNRGYELPEYAGSNTFVIISSYSGNTEETISAYKDALRKKCRVACITSNGEIEKMAKDNGHPYIKLPPGYQPRAALGYSFFSTLAVMENSGFCSDKKEETQAAISMLQLRSDEYSNYENENKAMEIAGKLKENLAVIYSSAELLEPVNLRWRGQIEENAKVLAYGNFYPEMNHNELVGWKLNGEIMKKIVVIFLKDKDDNERVKLRMDITKEIYSKYAGEIIELESASGSRLERLFSLTYLGDWVSYYLAILNEVDPAPVEVIDYLKKKLAE